MPPWQVEDAPLVWLDRYMAWENAKADRGQSAKKLARGETRNVGGKQIKRLI